MDEQCFETLFFSSLFSCFPSPYVKCAKPFCECKTSEEIEEEKQFSWKSRLTWDKKTGENLPVMNTGAASMLPHKEASF